MDLRHGDCLEVMNELENDSVDLLFADLPYHQTSCKWDVLIDLKLFWEQVNRVCKPDTPMVFTCSVKFGNTLINSNPKNFRYDLVWVKSASCGFLNAKKMPMKKHEMIYIFYRKLPKVYTENIALQHTHKFLKETENKRKVGGKGCYTNGSKTETCSKYDPPLPNSIIKEETCKYDINKNTYGGGKAGRIKISKAKQDHVAKYDPPLPNSIIKEEKLKNYDTLYGNVDIPKHQADRPNERSRWSPPLPNSIIKEDTGVYNECDHSSSKKLFRDTKNCKNDSELYGDVDRPQYLMRKKSESMYNPQLPNSILEVKSEKGKHATQKPVALMEWILKYYSREGGVVLDATMGSGSMGVACINKNRNFIGIEKDETIYKVALDRCGS